jgi:hypothetical protein
VTTFWDLFKQSVILQGVLTVMIWGTICYLVATGQAVPDIISAGGMGILGFWFGTKTTSAVLVKPAPE